MRPLAGAGKLLSIILLALAAMLWAPLPCAAVVIHEIYSDAPGEGFKDTTPLPQDQRDMLSSLGNNARTLGEARKNAFEHATSTLERRLTNSSTIRIEAEFVFFDGQEDGLNPGECGDLGNTVVIGFAGPAGYGFHRDRLDVKFYNSDPPTQIDPPGIGTAYPYALFEALGYPDLNGQGADVRIEFTRCIDFYYGITEPPPGSNVVDFIQLAIHEIMHGIGFLSLIESDGSYRTRILNVSLEGRNGEIFNDIPAEIKFRTIFDEQLYSESDGETLVDASPLERRFAITSQTGLLWEGTDGGENARSCGVRMARDAHPSARASDGKPLLHAPASFEEASSVSHVYSSAGDTMEATAPSPRKMELSLGMLRDLGWKVSGLPSECTPGGVTRNPTPQPPPPPPPPPPSLKPDPEPETEPEREPDPEPETEPEREPEEKQLEPAAPEQSGGAGGCALHSGEEKDHRHSYPLYLLLGAFYVFTALFVKNRSEAE